MRRNVLPKLIEICMETTSGWAPAWRPETNRNIGHWVFSTKGWIYSSSAWTFQIGQILRNKSYFLINITALSAVMSMPRHAKAYKFKRTLSQIQEPILSKKLVWVLVLSCSYSSWNQNFRRINSFVVRILVTLCENRQLSWYCNCYQSYRTGSRNS